MSPRRGQRTLPQRVARVRLEHCVLTLTRLLAAAQVPEPHPDIGDWWALYDYGLDTVKTWPKGCVSRTRCVLR